MTLPAFQRGPASNAPPRVNYETYVKFGRHWVYVGERDADTMRGCALMTSYVQGRKVIGVRPAGSRDKIYVYRFKHVADVHHGR